MLEKQDNTPTRYRGLPIVVSAIALLMVSALSWELAPAPWAPSSLATILPAGLLEPIVSITPSQWHDSLFFLCIAMTPAVGFLLSSYSLRKGGRLGRFFSVFFWVTLGASALFHLILFDKSVEMHGYSYTVAATVLNASFAVVLLVLLGLQRRSPSYTLRFAQSWIFWAWIGWSAFPWFLEMC